MIIPQFSFSANTLPLLVFCISATGMKVPLEKADDSSSAMSAGPKDEESEKEDEEENDIDFKAKPIASAPDTVNEPDARKTSIDVEKVFNEISEVCSNEIDSEIHFDNAAADGYCHGRKKWDESREEKKAAVFPVALAEITAHFFNFFVPNLEVFAKLSDDHVLKLVPNYIIDIRRQRFSEVSKNR